MEHKIKQNKIRTARRQLVEDFVQYHNISIPTDHFIEYDLSERIHKQVYLRIQAEDIIKERQAYEFDVISVMLQNVLNKYDKHALSKVLLYPATSCNVNDTCHKLYLEFPTAMFSTINECNAIVTKVIHENPYDIIIVEENLEFGIVISEDETECIYFDYWVQ